MILKIFIKHENYETPNMIGKTRFATLLVMVSFSQNAVAGLDEAYAAYQKGDYAAASAEWILLAQQNNAQAQYQLAKAYSNGQGVEQDYKRAFAWFSRAAEQGHADAQNDLGSFYATGLLFKKDYQHAVAWYAKAAQQNHAQAQNNLGILYGLGKGVEQNDLQSYKWLSIASTNGYEKATIAKEKLAKALTPDQLAQAETITQAWLRAYNHQYN
jgi:TPR repeat protein